MRYLVFFFILLGISACNPFAKTPLTQVLRTEQVQSQGADNKLEVSEPGQPPEPSPTPSQIEQKRATTPEPTEQTVNIATIIADPVADFTNAYIYSFAHLANGQLLVTIEVPGAAGDLHGHYELNIEDEILRCITLKEYPNRLYCHGPTTFAGKVVTIRLIQFPSKSEVYTTKAGIPPSPYLSAQNIRPGGKSDKNDKKPEIPPTEPPAETPPPYPYP